MALISVGVELLLREDVTTRLSNNSQHVFPKAEYLWQRAYFA
jgi:hypothetical protein